PAPGPGRGSSHGGGGGRPLRGARRRGSCLGRGRGGGTRPGGRREVVAPLPVPLLRPSRPAVVRRRGALLGGGDVDGARAGAAGAPGDEDVRDRGRGGDGGDRRRAGVGRHAVPAAALSVLPARCGGRAGGGVAVGGGEGGGAAVGGAKP